MPDPLPRPPARPAPTLAALVAAPLYFGPFLAGLAQGPAALLPVFVAIWTIWQMLVRPPGWGRPAVPGVALGGLWLGVLAHGLLIVAAFATGRGFAVLIGGALALPGWIAVALALTALPLGLRLARPAVLDGAPDPADQGEPAGTGA